MYKTDAHGEFKSQYIFLINMSKIFAELYYLRQIICNVLYNRGDLTLRDDVKFPTAKIPISSFILNAFGGMLFPYLLSLRQ